MNAGGPSAMHAAGAANAAEFALLNDFQRDFPLCERPFGAIARELGVGEDWVVQTLARMTAEGQVSRVGPVFAPNAIGASTLAALRVAPDRLDQVADRVSDFAQVNHNYARDHALNLWFVATARDAHDLDGVLNAIEARARSGPVVALPLLEELRIDLAFDLRRGALPGRALRAPRPASLDARDWRIIAALESGLPLVGRPFAVVAARAQSSETQVLGRIVEWVESAVIRRFGVVVRHHELGFAANAMAVWDVPDRIASRLGRRLAHQPGVSLCYRRRRAQPDWPYNLFCMVHGRDRRAVREQIDAAAHAAGLDRFSHALLFSVKRYKQRGACYAVRFDALRAVA